MSITVEAIDYHRNGVGGAPFYVAIIRAADDPEMPGRYLVQFAPAHDEDGELVGVGKNNEGEPLVSVLNLEAAHQGNIYMHQQLDQEGTGGNAFRGDVLVGQWLPELMEAITADRKASDAHMLEQHHKREQERRQNAAAVLASHDLPADAPTVEAVYQDFVPGASYLRDDVIDILERAKVL